MNRKTFINYLRNPQLLDEKSIQGLTDLLKDFPYCQSAQLLLTLNFYKEKHFRFDEELKNTAIASGSRKVLKKHIDRMSKPDPVSTVVFEEKPAESKKEESTVKEIKAFPVEEAVEKVHKNAEKEEKLSRSVGEIIDEFIKKEPSITRAQHTFFNPVEAAKISVLDEENIVSETLAKIYFDQSRFEKTINIYKKLSLKFPEKSSYFAALILKAEEELKK